MNFELPALYAIANFVGQSQDLHFVQSLISAGIELLQIRGKDLEHGQFLTLARDIKAYCESVPAAHRPKIIVNDNVQICKELVLDGVHLGQDDANPLWAREELGKKCLIGLSTHSLKQVQQADPAVVNYLGFGPIYSSLTKSGHAPTTGTEELRAACKISALPIVAIGGITTQNALAVYQAGAKSVAVIGDLLEANNLSDRIRTYKDLLSLSRGNTGTEEQEEKGRAMT